MSARVNMYNASNSPRVVYNWRGIYWSFILHSESWRHGYLALVMRLPMETLEMRISLSAKVSSHFCLNLHSWQLPWSEMSCGVVPFSLVFRVVCIACTRTLLNSDRALHKPWGIWRGNENGPTHIRRICVDGERAPNMCCSNGGRSRQPPVV